MFEPEVPWKCYKMNVKHDAYCKAVFYIAIINKSKAISQCLILCFTQVIEYSQDQCTQLSGPYIHFVQTSLLAYFLVTS